MINPAWWADLRRSGDTFVVGLIETFLEIGPERLREASQAIERADWPTVRHHVHGLKSSSSMLGAEKLAAVCADVERMATEGDVALIPDRFAALSAVYDDTIAWFVTQQKELGA